MIHYITIWGENNIGRNLSYSPAGLKKAKYVVDVLSRIDTTKIVSFANGGFKWNGLYRKTTQEWNDDISIEYCFTFGSSNKYVRMIERCINILQMCLYLLRVPKNDVIVFYHERYFKHAIKFLRIFKKKPKIIYQVEEIYTLAGNYTQKMVNEEIQSIKQADAYILVNDIISSILELPSFKPSCISYGAYMPQNAQPYIWESDDRVHVVYAGIFDRIKRGAEMAINACKYLPRNYCIHIAGFGKPDDVNYITSLIETIRKDSKCEIIYEGCLSGNDYDKLMSKCSIGLSTQTSGEFKYADTSFPSKVINYLSYGLTVVSTKIKVLELCKISDYLSFYSNDTPQAVANAIVNCPIIDRQKAKLKIKELDNVFQTQLQNIIQCLKK